MGRIVGTNNQPSISFLILLCISLSLPLSNSCRSEERTALLQFKNHFSINESSRDCDPLTKSWTDDKDCCMWDYILCDHMTGHVIELSLDDSCLNGTIPLNSSLFSLVHLQWLSLKFNHFGNSPIPSSFGKLRKLTYLDLGSSGFSGIVPDEIFQLPKLQTLSLGQNYGLTGKLVSPNATVRSELVTLDLSDTGISGELPNSIDQFKSLQFLDLSGCKFFGSIPTSLGNMTNLHEIYFENNHFGGKIPLSISNLQNLALLDLGDNYLYGSIPPLGNKTKLGSIRLHGNSLSGQLPSHLFNLSALHHLDVSENQLTGTIDLNIFANLPKLEFLSLSKTGLLVRNTSSNILSILPNIQVLYLSSCGISTNKLTYLNAPKSLYALDLSENKIDTEIHPSICNLISLLYLDLSDNRLRGVIPICLGRSGSFQVLKLEKNNLRGIIPQSIGYSSKLQVLDLSNNRLQGVVPRTLAYCTELEVINLGHNMLVDYFPFWLGKMSMLKVLILRENKFHGKITGKFELEPGVLANLHIIDASYNDLTGPLPSNFFLNLKSLMRVNEGIPGSLYMKDAISDTFYSVSIMSKGQLLNYPKVFVNFKVIDFSHNKFNENIPISVGNLAGIQILNFSGNILTGQIPFSLGNLTNLESLDLSRNKLLGKVPQELASLSFLEVFDVSHNNLTGPIPQGVQFNTFSSTSYEGNPGLCGPPLLKLCSNPIVQKPTLAPRRQHYKFELNGFGWEEVMIGYIGGLVFGLIIGCFLVKEEWVEHFFLVKRRKKRRS